MSCSNKHLRFAKEYFFMSDFFEVSVGSSCNSNCIFCVSKDRNENKDKTTSEIRKDLEEGKTNSADNVTFTGGEPTIRPDILELVSYAKELGFKKIRIKTNGRMLYYRGFCERLIRCGANDFDIHVQGHNDNLHDSITGTEKSFSQAQAGIENLKELKQNVSMTVVLNQYNFSFLEDMLSFAKLHNITEVTVSPVDGSDDSSPVRNNFLSGIEKRQKELSEKFPGLDISWPCIAENKKAAGEKKFRIVFVWFSSTEWTDSRETPPNLSTVYMAKVLEMHGFECVCVDVDMLKDISISFYTGKGVKNSMKKLIRIVDSQDPDLVAVGSWSRSMPFAAEFIKQFKEQSEETMIVLGGFNATVLPEETLSIIPEVDCLVRGVGEVTMKELASSIRDGKDWRKVSNISYLKDGKTVSTQDKKHCFELDSLPYVDFENVYGLKSKKFNHISLMTSRGCIYDCTYCSVHIIHNKYIEYSPQYTIAQIKHLSDLYDFGSIVFRDDSLMNNRKKAIRLAKSIKSNSMDNFYYSYQSRLNQTDYDTLRILRDSNFSSIFIGIESASADVLRFFNKRVDYANQRQNVLKTIEKLNRLNIFLNTAFIMGTPNETEKELYRTVGLIGEVLKKTDAVCIEPNILVLYPGTDLWNDYVRGKYEVFKAFEFYQDIFRKYSSIPSMASPNFLIRHFKYTDDRFLKLISTAKQEVLDEIEKYRYKDNFSNVSVRDTN